MGCMFGNDSCLWSDVMSRSFLLCAEQALGQTFSWAVFLGNGLMAIFAGFLGDYLVERMGLGR